jgi:hypothetical protein
LGLFFCRNEGNRSSRPWYQVFIRMYDKILYVCNYALCRKAPAIA